LRGTATPVILLRDLNEPVAGRFEGGPVDVYNDHIVANGYWAPNPDGESQADALRRFIRAYQSILDHPGRSVLVVAHGLPIAWLREGLRGVGTPSDLGINFKEPGVMLATPYRFSRDDVRRAAIRLAAWAAAGDVPR
jgi:broad specificity phosphatase PhoE